MNGVATQDRNDQKAILCQVEYAFYPMQQLAALGGAEVALEDRLLASAGKILEYMQGSTQSARVANVISSYVKVARSHILAPSECDEGSIGKTLQEGRVDNLVGKAGPRGSAYSALPVQEDIESMAVWFVSRHPGARAWAREEGLEVDVWCDHLEVERISEGDTVIGSLPVPMVAEVCRRGAVYWHLTLDLPSELRGCELSAMDMRRLKVRLEQYCVSDGAGAKLRWRRGYEVRIRQ